MSIISQRLFPTVDKKGRRAATEILINNPAIANLIRNEKIHQIVNVMQTSKAAGMQTLETSIKELIQSGVISKEAVEPYLTGEAEVKMARFKYTGRDRKGKKSGMINATSKREAMQKLKERWNPSYRNDRSSGDVINKGYLDWNPV